tara:strand:+ start:294 stop:551 length:258 start_codon:yes stop_codon:yes gene_type:complete
MSIQESLDNLRSTVDQANAMIQATENIINTTMDALMKNAKPEELLGIQNNVKTIKNLMNKAKRGENIDAEVNAIAKTINNGSRNK